MDYEAIRKIQERLDLIEFKQELLYWNSPGDKFLFRHNITREQYLKIQDVFEKYNDMIIKGQEVSYIDFENDIYMIVPKNHSHGYSCENLAWFFMESGRWFRVYDELYTKGYYKMLRENF